MAAPGKRPWPKHPCRRSRGARRRDCVLKRLVDQPELPFSGMDDPNRAAYFAPLRERADFSRGSRDPRAERPLISAFFTPSSRLLTARRVTSGHDARFLHGQSGARRGPSHRRWAEFRQWLTRLARSDRVNDVHSQLNERPSPGRAAWSVVANSSKSSGSAAGDRSADQHCGGRHAMGGQQFGSGGVLLDMTRIESCPRSRLAVAGSSWSRPASEWPQLVNHLLWAGAGQARQWGIIQKQTGADRLSIGGALAANIHGRGLRMRPIIGDIESFDARRCPRRHRYRAAGRPTAICSARDRRLRPRSA